MHKQTNLKGKVFVLALCAMFAGCDDSTEFNKYVDVCEVSGGSFRDGKCFCGIDDINPCDPGVVCSTADSTVCADGAKQIFSLAGLPCLESGKALCIDGSYQKCDSGKWSEIKTCSSAANKKIACANSNACGECFENELICRLDNGMYVQQQCKHGKWVTLKECGSFGCNADNTCATQKCTVKDGKTCQNDMNQAGTMHECNGDATEITKCGIQSGSDFVPYSCGDDDKKCGDCLNGATKCENGELAICSEGKWGAPVVCPDGAACNEDGTACQTCKIGAVKCKDGQSYKCEYGKWSDPLSCANNASCKNEIECGECRSNTNVCTAGTQYTCVNGIKESPDPCKVADVPVSCKSETSCGECANGQIKCENNTMGIGVFKECKNGVWDEGKFCENNASCADAKTCGDCKDKDIKCDNINGIGQESTCEEGVWKNVRPCSNSASCNPEKNRCGECRNGKVEDCKNQGDNQIGEINTCENGQWKAAQCAMNPLTAMRNSCCNDTQCSVGECGSCNISKKFYCEGDDSYQCINGYGIVYDSKCTKGCNLSTGKCN